jgi:hypothetical protein
MDDKRKREKAKEKTNHRVEFRKILNMTHLLKAMIFLLVVMMKWMLIVAGNDC